MAEAAQPNAPERRELRELLYDAAPGFAPFRNMPIELVHRVERALEKQFPRCRCVQALLRAVPAEPLRTQLSTLAALAEFSAELQVIHAQMDAIAELINEMFKPHEAAYALCTTRMEDVEREHAKRSLSPTVMTLHECFAQFDPMSSLIEKQCTNAAWGVWEVHWRIAENAPALKNEFPMNAFCFDAALSEQGVALRDAHATNVRALEQSAERLVAALVPLVADALRAELEAASPAKRPRKQAAPQKRAPVKRAPAAKRARSEAAKK